jgi:hypothetical protein
VPLLRGAGLGCSQGGVFPLGVDGGGVGDDQREREALAGFCPRATLSPRLQTVNDKRKRVLVISRIQRRS